MDHSQRPATGHGQQPTMPPESKTHTVPDNSEQVQEGRANNGEPLPRIPSPDQIQQSAELEPFILPTKPAVSLSSDTCVSSGGPRTPVPARARPLFRVWMLETASLLLSFSCFICKSKATIPSALSLTCSKGLPDWPLSITLNSFVAFFTTLTKATFMLPVSTAISQIKWSWFLQDRPIYDFHILDQASRGIRGSFMLLWRAHFKNFISLGAFVVIASTLTSPVTQLAINYSTRDREVPGDAYARAIRKIETPTDGLSLATSKAVQLAIASDNSLFNNPMPPLETFCSTGNCTFDKYHTLGVCVKMANISSHLKIETVKHLESADIIPPPLEILKVFQPPEIKLWNASLSDNFYLMHLDSFPLYTDMLAGNDTFGFRHDMNLLRTRIASFALIFTTPIYNDKTLKEDDLIQLSEPLPQRRSGSYADTWPLPLNSRIRRADLDYTEHGFNVTGKAWTSESYVQIQWGWLSFLAFELVLAAGLLAMTIATQKSNQKSDRESYDMVCDLKDSSLAALVALDNDCRSVVGNGLGPVRELEKTAREVHVRLRGNRLVVVDATHHIRGGSA
ncbi:hypothetical protein NCS56_00327800 [Fusarium sp. Ph1]|nr:hypothetical protein NCS56_00327800 [Fusarium sp. Ph1]